MKSVARERERESDGQCEVLLSLQCLLDVCLTPESNV